MKMSFGRSLRLIPLAIPENDRRRSASGRSAPLQSCPFAAPERPCDDRSAVRARPTRRSRGRRAASSPAIGRVRAATSAATGPPPLVPVAAPLMPAAGARRAQRHAARCTSSRRRTACRRGDCRAPARTGPSVTARENRRARSPRCRMARDQPGRARPARARSGSAGARSRARSRRRDTPR